MQSSETELGGTSSGNEPTEVLCLVEKTVVVHDEVQKMNCAIPSSFSEHDRRKFKFMFKKDSQTVGRMALVSFG